MHATVTNPEPFVFTKAEASRRTGLNLKFIDRMVKEEKLKTFQYPGRRPVILASSLKALIAELNGDLNQAG